MVFFGAPSGPALLSAVGLLVHGRPSASLGFLLGNASMFVAFLDVFGLAFLFFGVARFVATRHRDLHQLNPEDQNRL
jgi:hypothetical protein